MGLKYILNKLEEIQSEQNIQEWTTSCGEYTKHVFTKKVNVEYRENLSENIY